MKKIITITLLLAFTTMHSYNAMAQTNDLSNVIGTKTESITESQNSKGSLWMNLQTWANAVATEYHKTIVSEDKDNGTMIVKLESYLPSGKPGFNEYSKVKVIMNIKIDCRDQKYRLIFSNFTSAIEADRTVDVKYMSTSSLEKMMKELQRATDLAQYDFDKETIWNVDKIIAIKNKYASKNDECKKVISMQDAESKKGKKEIKDQNYWIDKNSNMISLLDFILGGFGEKVNNIRNDISKSMSVSDNF